MMPRIQVFQRRAARSGTLRNALETNAVRVNKIRNSKGPARFNVLNTSRAAGFRRLTLVYDDSEESSVAAVCTHLQPVTRSTLMTGHHSIQARAPGAHLSRRDAVKFKGGAWSAERLSRRSLSLEWERGTRGG